MTECEIDTPTERLLSHEDAVSIPEAESCNHFKTNVLRLIVSGL